MSRVTKVVVLSALALMGGCATSKKPEPTGGLQPLTNVARDLDLKIKPTGFAEDRLLVDRKGRAFYVMADKPYYRFMGDKRTLSSDQRVRVAGKELLVPGEMVAAMREDLRGVPARPNAKPKPPVVRPKPRPGRKKPPRLFNVKIVIDAGHGGKDPGAVRAGVTEKSVVLPIANKVVAKLRALGATPIPTRTGDVYPSLDRRAAIANQRSADYFLSIHANSAANKRATGVEAYYRADGRRGAISRMLATSIVDSVVARTGANNRRARADARGLRVLRKTRMPAVLPEVGFLSNTAERRRLTDPGYQERIAQGIVDGIVSHLYTPTPAL